LRRYRQFYLAYPRIRESLSPELGKTLLPQAAAGNKRESLTPEMGLAASEVLTKLSFSHIAELLQCDDATKRTFYELECIRGNWSVRELKRQIASLYYERSGLSKDKGKLATLAQEGAERVEPTLPIRDPYVFEFLGLKPQEVMGESHLEDHLLDKLHDFLIELGHGFCFEARQKRMRFEDEDFYVDLVFYNYLLKCFVLIDLKAGKLTHQDIGQLERAVFRALVTLDINHAQR